MSDYEIGDVAHLAVEFTDDEGAPVDPITVSLEVRDPAGTDTTPTPTRDGVGLWHYDLALPTAGRWAYRWTSSADAQSAQEGEVEVAETLLYDRPEWLPGPNDVAALLRSRLREAGGRIPSTFTDTTSPTRAQVQKVISEQAPFVTIETGDLSDAKLTCENASDVRRAVRTLIAQRTAGVIEAAYWPQDTASGETAEEFWRRLVEIDTPKVVAAARECRLGEVQPGGDGDAGGGIAIRPAFSFNSGPRVGNRPF